MQERFDPKKLPPVRKCEAERDKLKAAQNSIVGDHPYSVFIASLFWKKLQTFLENVASPFWRNVHLHGATYAAPWKQTFFVKSY